MDASLAVRFAETAVVKKAKSHRSARARERLANVVPHPRYGSAVVALGRGRGRRRHSPPPDWSKDVIFPESAIRADSLRQVPNGAVTRALDALVASLHLPSG